MARNPRGHTGPGGAQLGLRAQQPKVSNKRHKRCRCPGMQLWRYMTGHSTPIVKRVAWYPDFPRTEKPSPDPSRWEGRECSRNSMKRKSGPTGDTFVSRPLKTASPSACRLSGFRGRCGGFCRPTRLRLPRIALHDPHVQHALMVDEVSNKIRHRAAESTESTGIKCRMGFFDR